MLLRGKATEEQLQYNPEIEKSTKSNRKKAKEKKQQGTQEAQCSSKLAASSATQLEKIENAHNANDNNQTPNPPRRTLGDYAMYKGPRHYSSIVIPHTARTMEIKPAYLNLVSAHQFMGKDYEDPYAHLDNFYELVATMGYFDTEREAAYMIFFPPARYVHAKFEISTFRQGTEEAFYEAWERFQLLLRKCPNHGFENIDQLNILCNGLKPKTKMILDAAAGGTMMAVDAEKATRVITALCAIDRQAQHNRRTMQKKGVLDLSTSDAILAQNKILTQQIEVIRCDFCGGNHVTGQYSMPIHQLEEEVQYVHNQPRQGNFSNNPPFNNQFLQVGEETRTRIRILGGGKKLGHLTDNHHIRRHTNKKNTDASSRNLETQVGQLAKQMADRQQFSANTQTNPKEHCKYITTRSGKVIGKGIRENLDVEQEVLRETEAGTSEKVIRDIHKGKEVEHEEGDTTDTVTRENNDERKTELPQLKDLPYPKRHSKKDKERQYARFLDLFKNLQINIPFMEAMKQMPVYAKFMKDLLTKKRKMSEETVTLEAGCRAIIQKSLLEKTKGPDSFTIPVTIGELFVGKALLDLGASINMMPLSMLKRIGDLEIKPTRMTLQLADRSVKYPYGVA
ncbi:PREDICTED: uncharacterized protein LOC109337307 [Lupinus angustifolius]|uniref:uncharacterized protein LOC109337307 n=1 Tax=Lupinus angustifolius TaxID=3871 RepID=UPI00092E7579|nr:PREDICTED: uncharacterized protein LOC109337307 [Lupinus angustifolius]